MADTGPPGLHRGLGRVDVIALTVNSIVGAGVFALPAGLAISSGRWSLAVVFAAFAVVALLALSVAEVASRYDTTGGPQYYAQVTFGPLAGFTVGWLFVVSRFASYALIAHIMLDYAAALWPALADRWPRAVAITVFTAALTAINLRGVTRGAWVGNVLTLAKMLPLSLIALAGLWFTGWNDIPATAPKEPDGLTDGLLLALFACFGFEVAAIVAGEMRDPRRDLAISILAGLAISCVLYLLLMLASFGVLPDTAASALPLADVAETFVGPLGGTIMAAAAVVSCAGGLAVAILVSPRNMFALGESGDLPRRFAA
ncbi:MAG: APC family permease, partial [Dongiaceae bacterium]